MESRVAVNVYRGVLVVVGVVALALVGVSVWTNTNVEEPNGCGMSYVDLLEQQFSPQPRSAPEWVPLTHHNRKHAHRLYRYVEAGERAGALHAVPLLFVHGNSGSWRQMRSLATRISQARRANATHAAPGPNGVRAPVPLLQADFFTIDFNEEKSAFSGRLMTRQALYVNECIRTLVALYPAGTRVFVVGHSMGGIVARSIFRFDNYVPGSVAAIVTLGTPHADPFIAADRELQQFYEQTNRLWRDPSAQPMIKDVILVSLSGGYRDHLIEPHLTDVSMLIPETHAVSVMTTAIPSVRLTVDHQCLLWCSQLMTAVERAITAMIATPDRALNIPYQKNAFTSPLRWSMEPVIEQFRRIGASPSQASAHDGTDTAAASVSSGDDSSSGSIGGVGGGALFRLRVSAFRHSRKLWIPPGAMWAGAMLVLNRSFDRIRVCGDLNGSGDRPAGSGDGFGFACTDVTHHVLPLSTLVSPLERTTSGLYSVLQLTAAQASARYVELQPSARLSSEAKLHRRASAAVDAASNAAAAAAAAATATAGGSGADGGGVAGTAYAYAANAWTRVDVPSDANSDDAEAVAAHFFTISQDNTLHLPVHFRDTAVAAAGAASKGWRAPFVAVHGYGAMPADSFAAESVSASPSVWQWLYESALRYTVDTQSFVLRDGSSVYYWEGHVPSGVERFFRLHVHSSSGAPWSAVYISSAPYHAHERLMVEDDFMLSTRGTKVVRFHRSNVARVVRFVFLLHPSHTYHVSVAVLSVRSFARTLYSKLTTLPQIFIATAFLLIALQYRHFLRYGVFQRFYHIFGFGQRSGAIRVRVSKDSSAMVCVWVVSVWAVIAGSPFSSAYLRFHSDWILEWIWLIAIGFIFVSASVVLWIAIELLCHGLFGLLSLPFASACCTGATSAGTGSGTGAGAGASASASASSRRCCSVSAKVRMRPHLQLFRLMLFPLTPIIYALWFVIWEPALALRPSAPALLRALHANRTLAAMLLLHGSGALLLVLTNAVTWHGRPPYRDFRAYKGTCFMLYLVSLFGSVPSWVFEVASLSPLSSTNPTALAAAGAAGAALVPGNGWPFPVSVAVAGVDLLFSMNHFDFETLMVLSVNALVLFASLHFPPRPSATPQHVLSPASSSTATGSSAARNGNGAARNGASTAARVAGPHELHVSLLSLHSLPSLLCLVLGGALGLSGRSAMIWLPLLTALVVLTLMLPQSFHALFHHVLPLHALWQYVDRARRAVGLTAPRAPTPPASPARALGGRPLRLSAAADTDAVALPLFPASPNGAAATGDGDGPYQRRLHAPVDVHSHSPSHTHVHAHANGHSHAHAHLHGHDEYGACPMSPELVATAEQLIPTLDL